MLGNNLTTAPPIQRMADKLTEAGPSYGIAHQVFRFYVRGLDLDSSSQIERVTNAGIFRVLWSLGMSDEKQDALSRSRQILWKV